MGNTADKRQSRNAGEVTLPDQQIRLGQAIEAEFGDELSSLPSLAWKEFGLTFGMDRAGALQHFRQLRDGEKFLFNMLVDITCVDWLDQRKERFELVYQLLSLTLNHRVCIKIAVPENCPEVDSVRSLWPAANFLEREVWDMFGIKFAGHGDLRRILLYEEFVGHPLRKDYPLRGKQPRVELRVPELRNTSADMAREQLVSLPLRKRSSGTSADQ